MVAIFISGFSGIRAALEGSQGKDPGVHQMADDPCISGYIQGPRLKMGHREAGDAAAAIVSALENNPWQAVIIVGHSYGADTAITVARILQGKEPFDALLTKGKSIYVDLLVQIDSWGLGSGDEQKPENVIKGYNLYATGSESGPDGEIYVEGSTNIPYDNTSHTDINNDPRVWQKVLELTQRIPRIGANSPLGLEGSNSDMEIDSDVIFDSASGPYPRSIAGDGTIEATGRIYAASKIRPDTKITMLAGNKITLRPGFHAMAGSRFDAGIGLPSGMRINVSPISLNFGFVLSLQSRAIEVTIRNCGMELLEIRAKAIQGTYFSIDSLPTIPFSLQSGGEQRIWVRYNAAGNTSHTGNFLIHSNDPEQPTVSISLKGESVIRL